MKTRRAGLGLRIYGEAYRATYGAIFRRTSPQTAHDKMRCALRMLDGNSAAVSFAESVKRSLAHGSPIEVGGVNLPAPLILAAGLVKGDGFADENEALQAMEDGRNILPGWRIVPALCGPVEFGSFTRHPRKGNQGTVIWRDEMTRSTQNRMGLPNPGALAVARFLDSRRGDLPAEFGINIAVSPGVESLRQRVAETIEALDIFLHHSISASWFTLNLSCPNTEDDPQNRQLAEETEAICGAVAERLNSADLSIPLWVKLGPCLAEAQYRALVGVLQDVGVKAIVATNTMPRSAPGNPGLVAGVGGGDLHAASLEAARHLTAEIRRRDALIDVVACGGIMDGESWRAYWQLGVKAGQYWSALVYRGPLAAALIQSELASYDYERAAIHRESLA